MINKVEVKNFKKFSVLDFSLRDHIVIAGHNNSGKTTLLQAIAAWSEIALLWREDNPDLARESDGNYPKTNLNLLDFYSVPIADFDHLWKYKDTKEPVSIWLHTSQWKIGFEILYKEQELAAIRPARQVCEDDLEKYINNSLVPVYIPPLSGLDVEEQPFNPIVVPARLAQSRAGSVLRNLLLRVSQDEGKWLKLEEVVKSFFGYELEMPSLGAKKILARYRHYPQDVYYDLSSAASGFLQVLMVYAVLLEREALVVLVDEPDAHLHVLLQGKMHRQLCEYARENRSQLIISTHSESLIKTVEPRYLCVLQSNDSKMIADNTEHNTLIKSLAYLDNMEICLVEEEINPRILYVEDYTDIDILCEWARRLDHRLHTFLEGPFWKKTSYSPSSRVKGISAKEHFKMLKLVREDVVGVELRDSDGKSRGSRMLPNGLKQIFWQRYEIESYLIHPTSIARFAESIGGEEAGAKVQKYLKENFSPAFIRNPKGENVEFKERKAKNILSTVLGAAGIEEKDYSLIAAQMNREEIHPEVTEKLDAIADHLGIEKD